jgi:Ca2+-binding EF-hand superfamily protein
MGWTTAKMEDFLVGIDPNQNGEITEEEFAVVMKYISQRAKNSKLPKIGSLNEDSISKQ